MRSLFSSLRPSVIALVFVAVYMGIAVLSVMVAHVLYIVQPQSGWAERIIAPVARGLQFLDTHWKSILILVAPFFAPVARDLIPRLRKVGGIEFDAVQLEQVGVREKPQVPPGETR